MAALYYSSRLVVAGLISHSIAILSTVFRLVYRGWTHHFWWEDAWAAFALISDVLCLACIWVDVSISSWTLALASPSVVWATRMSVIFSIIRVSKHTVHRQSIYLIAALFACMWAAILAQKLTLCHLHRCHMGKMVALSQLITDVIADVALVAMPLYLWRNSKLSRGSKILVLSAFSASLIITAVTIAHSIFLIRPHSRSTIIFSHVKAAVSLIICNLLVIVTFAYRVFYKETFDLDQPLVSRGLFTSIVMVQSHLGTNAEISTSHDETFATQKTTVRFGATKPNLEEESVDTDAQW